jgi:hypothetical protein
MKKYKSVYLIGGFFMAKSPFSALEKYEIITTYEIDHFLHWNSADR